MRALFTAATGMAAQQLRIDNIANNLSNVNTTAFKKSRADFEDLYYQKIRTGSGQTQAGTGRNDVVEVGHGTRTAALRREFRPGAIVADDVSTHVAIRGEGFFSLQTAEGEELFTRNGAFSVDGQGNLVTAQGHTLTEAITIPEGATINVAADGLVISQIAGEDPQEVGQIQLRRFINSSGLEALGAGLYRSTELSGQPQLGNPGSEGLGELMGGALEASNVDVAEELISMIMAQRSYELTSKAISTSDEMLQVTNRLKA
jgi:flagellar basal-body rod protein FlgG